MDVLLFLVLLFRATGKLPRASANKHRRGSLGFARDGFVGGLAILLVRYAENTKRSKKSQALEMTIPFAW
jgi:hypothetical protein